MYIYIYICIFIFVLGPGPGPGPVEWDPGQWDPPEVTCDSQNLLLVPEVLGVSHQQKGLAWPPRKDPNANGASHSLGHMDAAGSDGGALEFMSLRIYIHVAWLGLPMRTQLIGVATRLLRCLSITSSL